MKTINAANRILVLGSTGKTGSRVYQKLQQQGVTVRPGSRNAPLPFDWDNAQTWAPVLEHIDAVYISYQPDLAVPSSIHSITEFTQLAVKHGVRNLVLLSGRGEPEAQACEEVIIHSGVDWTIIRASWFCQNFSEGYLIDPIRQGHVALPVPTVGEPFVDVDDIAEIAVAAFTQDGHHQQIYEVTGPRLLTFQQAITEISIATGKRIVYEGVTMDDYAGMLTEYGVPGEYISLLSYLFTEVLDGRNAHITDGVERALGRKATDFSTYVEKAVAAGVWN
ncbi:hypothetical protein [Paraflavitalea sp. CAU 1676]|uniref:hypothetical protein n=1 Tax=Paraflavitalea sp. CAU 1676 TaxID=3032598 RepID=UPI0023DA77EF|nr:hypothetical protein [Paraflavitalea sp. CAU 1676]MDF2190092.1 hypothetical protein [Paraflavitalea sp. CAU 1676]